MIRNGMIIFWVFAICFGIVNPMIALMCEEAKKVGLSDSIITNTMLFHIYRVVSGMCAVIAIVFTALHMSLKKEQPIGPKQKSLWNKTMNSIFIQLILVVVFIECFAKVIITIVADTF